jgi:hypothetical protein
MNYRHGLGLAALGAAPLLASCMVRWDPSPENDDDWDDDGWEVSVRGPSISEGAGRWSEPATPESPSAPRPPRPPLIPESEPAGSDDATARAIAENYRDLIVIDPEIVAGPLSASVDEDAPFSFRAQMQWLAGASRDPLEFTHAWLSEWENTSEVGGQYAPVTPRWGVRGVLVEPWLAASGVPYEAASSAASGYGDATGDTSGDEPYSADDTDPYVAVPSDEAATGYPSASSPLPSWDYDPFRLIAIVNRIDLASSACKGYPGELRYVYAAVDPETSTPLDVTLIVEIPYPATRTPAEWARAWRDLAALPPGEQYTRGLAELAREIRADGDPLRARVRTNEMAFSDPSDPDWEMRQFDVQIRSGALGLAQVPLEFTPRADADPAELADFVLEHAQEIEGAGVSLPENLRAGAARIDTPDFSWSVLGVSERSRRAFSIQTCNGCHGGDTASLPFRHIAAGATLEAPAQLSRFIYDPEASTDELRRRDAVLDALSAAECASSAPSDTYSGG